MMRTSIVFVLVLGCGTAAPVASAPPPPPTTEAPPASVAASAPADFTMEIGGGLELLRPPQPGEMVMVTRLEPRSDAPGQFDLVRWSEPAPPSEGTPRIEMQRVAVPAARVSSLYALVESGRAVLERPCVNLDVLDGESHFVRVHANGADAEYRCTNTSTPELDALTSAFQALTSDLLPATAES